MVRHLQDFEEEEEVLEDELPEDWSPDPNHAAEAEAEAEIPADTQSLVQANAEEEDRKLLDVVQTEDAKCVQMRQELGLPSYAEVVLARWKKCKAETADILVDPAPRKGWKNTSRRATIIFPNAVHGSPHKRMLHRLLKAAKGFAEPLYFLKDVERECRPAPEIPTELACLEDEVIVTVSIYSLKGDKEQEYDILSTQTLEELRDAFYFVEDWTYDGPTRLDSACFFIDGIFYSDRRWESALDYSKQLILGRLEISPNEGRHFQ